MGAEVTVITTSPDKTKDAKRFGAKDVLVSAADYPKHKRAFDFILDTIPYQHDLNPSWLVGGGLAAYAWSRRASTAQHRAALVGPLPGRWVWPVPRWNGRASSTCTPGRRSGTSAHPRLVSFAGFTSRFGAQTQTDTSWPSIRGHYSLSGSRGTTTTISRQHHPGRSRRQHSHG
jgi:hypothetical protein